MKRLQELLALHEAGTMKLYVQDPYGAGFDTTPVTRGEVLTREDGDEVAFQKISADGKYIIGKNSQGKTIEVSLADISGKVLPSGETPVPGKGGFMAEGREGSYDVEQIIDELVDDFSESEYPDDEEADKMIYDAMKRHGVPKADQFEVYKTIYARVSAY